jgi:hypothetical protein
MLRSAAGIVLAGVVATATAHAQSRVWEVPGTGGSTFAQPKWVAAGAELWVYAIDTRTRTIVRFDPFTGARQELAGSGLVGEAADFVVGPDGWITVAVAGRGRGRIVQIRAGEVRTLANGGGLQLPTRIVAAPEGGFYVIDPSRSGILAVTPTAGAPGEFTTTLIAGGNAPVAGGPAAAQDDPLRAVIQPLGLAVLRDGSILFSDAAGPFRLLERQAGPAPGRFQWRLAAAPITNPSQPGQGAPGDLALGPGDQVYAVGARGGHGIEQYSRSFSLVGWSWHRAPFAGRHPRNGGPVPTGPGVLAAAIALDRGCSLGAVPHGGLLVAHQDRPGIHFIGLGATDGPLYARIEHASMMADAGWDQPLAVLVADLWKARRAVTDRGSQPDGDTLHLLGPHADASVRALRAGLAIRELERLVGGDLDRFSAKPGAPDDEKSEERPGALSPFGQAHLDARDTTASGAAAALSAQFEGAGPAPRSSQAEPAQETKAGPWRPAITCRPAPLRDFFTTPGKAEEIMELDIAPELGKPLRLRALDAGIGWCAAGSGRIVHLGHRGLTIMEAGEPVLDFGVLPHRRTASALALPGTASGRASMMWVTLQGGQSLARMPVASPADPEAPDQAPVREPFPPGDSDPGVCHTGRPGGLAIAPDSAAWVPLADGFAGYDLETRTLRRTIQRSPDEVHGVEEMVAGPSGAVLFWTQETYGLLNVSPGRGAWMRECRVPGGGRAFVDAMETVWIARAQANEIVEVDLTPSGRRCRQHPLGLPGWPTEAARAGIFDLAMGPDGCIWFTAQAVDAIGRLDPRTGTVTYLPLPMKGGLPAHILDGQDGNLYFTYAHPFVRRIGRIRACEQKSRDPWTESILTGPPRLPRRIVNGRFQSRPGPAPAPGAGGALDLLQLDGLSWDRPAVLQHVHGGASPRQFLPGLEAKPLELAKLIHQAILDPDCPLIMDTEGRWLAVKDFSIPVGRFQEGGDWIPTPRLKVVLSPAGNVVEDAYPEATL